MNDELSLSQKHNRCSLGKKRNKHTSLKLHFKITFCFLGFDNCVDLCSIRIPGENQERYCSKTSPKP